MYPMRSIRHAEVVDSEIKQRFGRRILHLRTERLLRQEDVEELVGLSREHLSNLENGRREACLENIGKLAKAFNVTISDLMKGV